MLTESVISRESHKRFYLSVVFLLLSIADFSAAPLHHPLLTNAGSALIVLLGSIVREILVGGTPKHGCSSVCNAKEVGLAFVCVRLFQCTAGQYQTIWVTQALVPWLLLLAERYKLKSLIGHEQSNDVKGLRPIVKAAPWRRYLVLATASTLPLLWNNGFLSVNHTVQAVIGAFFLSCCLEGLDYMYMQQHQDVTRKSRFPQFSEKTSYNAYGEDSTLETEACNCTTHILKQVAAYSGLAFGLLSYLFEPLDLTFGDPQQAISILIHSFVGAMLLWALVSMVVTCGSANTSLVFSGAANITGFLMNASLRNSAPLTLSLQTLFLSSRHSIPGDHFLRSTRWYYLLMICALCAISVSIAAGRPGQHQFSIIQHNLAVPPMDSQPSLDISSNGAGSHPIKRLMMSAEVHRRHLLSSQSQSLDDAVKAYKARYSMPPPPSFDKWYKYARDRNVQIYDEYDTVYDVMLPFWALKPRTIRARVQEAIGYEENFLMALKIRNGRIMLLEGGLPWQQEAIKGMLHDFTQHLPDLDVAFNAHDESRVIVPHDQLSNMIEKGKQAQLRTSELQTFKHEFSPQPSDMNDGRRIKEYRDSRFNEYPQQSSSGPSRLSCASDSPARAIDDADAFDNVSTYSIQGPVRFISNQTAYTDVCNTPSLKGTHAFFDRPNAFNVAHDLIPIFSESKISSFQDIPYPSLWHWYGKIFTNNTRDMHIKNKPTYEEKLDPAWYDKQDDLYWRGSTTGGFSRAGGWRRHHRQRIVHYLNGRDNATVLAPTSSRTLSNQTNITTSWVPQRMAMKHLSSHVNVSFSGVGQCAESDCDAQKEFFHISRFANISEAYKHKYVLDMDGNAFSARFYGLMRSKSLVFKQAMFREWHDEWLIPWAHYIPLSLNTGKGGGRGWEAPASAKDNGESEWAETLRYFVEEDAKAEQEGLKGPGQTLAEMKREWANSVLRREDMQAWMFRLLLEYARVVDDRRDELGFVK